MPTTRYLIFDAQQRPFEIQPSLDDRTIYSCNYVVSTDGVSAKYLEQVAQKLEDAGIGTRNTNIFLGLKRTLPTGTGPFIRLLETSGVSPDLSYGSSSIIDMPGLQVLVIGDNPTSTHDKAIEVYNNLIASSNVSLSDS